MHKMEFIQLPSLPDSRPRRGVPPTKKAQVGFREGGPRVWGVCVCRSVGVCLW